MPWGFARQTPSAIMVIIKSTAPHFVRCIKPNGKNAPLVFDRPSVAEQLRYQGVLQAIKMSRSGFPIRLFHRDCFLDFRHLLEKALRERLEYTATSGKYNLHQNLITTYRKPNRFFKARQVIASKHNRSPVPNRTIRLFQTRMILVSKHFK